MYDADGEEDSSGNEEPPLVSAKTDDNMRQPCGECGNDEGDDVSDKPFDAQDMVSCQLWFFVAHPLFTHVIVSRGQSRLKNQNLG